MTEARIIKRYANRKLYDTQHSRYVTLDQISEMIRAGDDVKIIDNKTKEDLTSVTLAQIIFEEEKKQRSFLPLQAMRNIIQHGGEQFASMVSQAQRRVQSILPRKEEGAEGELGDEGVIVGDDETYGGVTKKNRESLTLREFREWIQQSQHTLDAWQKRVDDRIRGVVEGISPFAGLQSDVKALSTRIADLESKLNLIAAAEEEARARKAAQAESEPKPNGDGEAVETEAGEQAS